MTKLPSSLGYDRDRVKEAVERAVNDAFSARKTVNVQLAIGLTAMVDAVFDELEQKKKVA